jgi:pimeloyl-ACP methyl ester carboxylesterase
MFLLTLLLQPDVETDETAFDYVKQGDDVAAVIEQFQLVKPIFVAWSYGAVIPADYIATRGVENVGGLIVVDGVTGPL